MAYTQAICIYIVSACLLKRLLSYGIYTGTIYIYIYIGSACLLKRLLSYDIYTGNMYIYRECLFVKKVALLWHIHRHYIYIYIYI